MAKAPIRNLKDLKFISIHHSTKANASMTLQELKASAKAYDKLHSTRSYAIETGAEFGYPWISYHRLFSSKGHDLQTQDYKYVRYHAHDWARGAESHNRWGIALCVDMNTSTHKISNSVKIAVANRIFQIWKELNRKLIVRTHKETALVGTECAGNIMGTHKKGTCKEIIDMANKLWDDYKNPKPPVVTPPIEPNCKEELKKLQGTVQEMEKVITSLRQENTQIRLENVELNQKIQEAIQVLQ